MNFKTRSPQDIAADLMEAHRHSPQRGAEVLVACLANEVRITHEPPMAIDGLRDGAQMRRYRLAEIPALERALDDFGEEIETRVEGDTLGVRMTISGHRKATGTPLREVVDVRYHVDNGKIVEVRIINTGGSGVMGEVLREGDFAP